MAFALLLIGGLVHGMWTQRWQPSPALDEACARLQAVPANAGRWKSTAVQGDPEAFRQARAVNYWMQQYAKDGAGQSITVILMCGRAGHMSVHTPDICYRGAGYEMAGDQVKETVAGAEFWTARFRREGDPAGNELRIRWAWSATGYWQAPASPRWTFGNEPFLYKLYVVYGGASDSMTDEFLREFLPVLDKSLFRAR